MSFFFFHLQISENRRAEQVLPGGRCGTSGKREEVRKGCERVKIVLIL
jgi:hypothetical protein